MKESLQQTTDLRQLQRLTPLQVRFVRMLEMNGVELDEEIHRAVDEMPALEVVNDEQGSADEHFDESAEQLQLADYRDDDDVPYYRERVSNASADVDDHFRIVVDESDNSIYDYLMKQIDEMPIADGERILAKAVAGNIDRNGYLSRSASQIADDLTFAGYGDITSGEVNRVIDMIRALDPAGVGAYDLRECLLLQLRRLPVSWSVELAIKVVEKHFDAFAKKHFDVLASQLDIDREQLREVVDVIKSLNPKPGASIDESQIEDVAKYIEPDATVEVDGDNISVALVNNIPSLAIEQTFAGEDTPLPSSSAAMRSEAMAFIRSRRDEAATFIKALEMRQHTLFNIVAAIVRFQRDFFLTSDEQRLRPMVLKDVASATGYDLSTVSRACSGKYISTPAGIFPLKYFFNEKSPASADDSNDVSSVQIASALRRLIDGEDKSKPLTDLQLKELLANDGLVLARRTVAKYRERLGYPIARLRREA